MSRLVLAACAALLAMPAQAQLYKCKGPDGKIVYSDQRCESKAEVAPVSGVKNDAHGIEQRAREEKEAAAKKAAELDAAADAAARAAARNSAASAPAVAPAEAAAPAAPARLSSGQEQRIRNLEATRAQAGNTEQQRRAAQLEIDAIRNGKEDRLSSADRDRRDNLIKDLGSLEPARRSAAMRDLEDLYRRAR